MAGTPKRGSKPGRPNSARSGPGRGRKPGYNRNPLAQGARGRGGAARTGPIGQRSNNARNLGGEQIEGRQAVRELLLAQRRKVYEIQISSELKDSDRLEDIVTIAAAERVPVNYVARKKLESAARSEAPQGVLARAAPLQPVPLHELISDDVKSPFLVAVDGVTDPGNLGAIVRSCDGAGVSGVVLPRHRAVHVTPTVAKASAGAIEYVPIALASGLPSALSELKSAGVWVIGFDDEADSSIFDLPAQLVARCCIVLGSEGAGLSKLVRQRCDAMFRIPMNGHVHSLNVSAAAALATYEVARHRQ